MRKYTLEGICWNDDCGQMSAWCVWSAIGLYPVNPADGKFVIGRPLVEKATIRLDSKIYPGGTFTVIAHNVSDQNIFIQLEKLCGKPLVRPSVIHQEIVNGGNLELELDVLPNKNWGAGRMKWFSFPTESKTII
jgi:putative alpha-1,2-mannosidase